MAKRFGEQLDRRVDAFIRRRFGGSGLYGPPKQGWWPNFRVAVLCLGGFALVVLVALGASGQWEKAPLILGTTAGLTAWYGVCLTVALRVRAHRSRRSASASATLEADRR